MFLTFVVSLLTLNLKQKMDDGYMPGILIGIMVGAMIMGVSLSALLPDHNDAYTKGITDCRSGKASYTVTVGPEGVDTTYTYKP